MMFVKDYLLRILDVYLFVFVISFALKKYLNIVLKDLLKKVGINIGIVSIEWESMFIKNIFQFLWQFLNSFMNKRRVELLHIYTSLLISIIHIILSGLFIYCSVIQLITWNKLDLMSIKLILPGYGNNSLTEYIPIFIFCSLIHEFGHYFSAKLFNVNPVSFRFQFAFFIPLTFIYFNSRSIYNLKKREIITILTSGIFYNLLLTLILKLIVMSANLQPGKDVVLNDILDKSNPLVGHNGLKISDRISKINNCNTSTCNEYYKCIDDISVSPQIGICTNEKYTFVNNTLNKCKTNEILFYPYEDKSLKTCIDIRDFLNRIILPFKYCNNDDNCSGNYKCLFPFFENDEDNFQLVFITKNDNYIIAYIGYVKDFLKTFSVIEPNTIRDYLDHLANISMNFALFNLLPCLNFDGHLLFAELVNMLPIQRKYQITITSFFANLFTCLMVLQLLINIF